MKSAFRQEGVIKSLLGGAERGEGVKSVLLVRAAGMVEENPFYSSAQHRATEFKRNKCPLRVSAREATKIK